MADLPSIEDAAHFLICWSHQDCITEDPPRDEDGNCKWRVWHLHPGVWNKMNSAERDLYRALMAKQ